MFEGEDKLIVLEYLLHVADISNCSKPWKISHKWSEKVLTEYFLQGDKEKYLGLPISPLCDRLIVELSKSQIGFIDVIVIPTFEAMVHYFPKFADNIHNLEENKK